MDEGNIGIELVGIAASNILDVPDALHASVHDHTVVVLLLAISTLLPKGVELLARLTEVLGEVQALLVGELTSINVVETDVSDILVLRRRSGQADVNESLRKHQLAGKNTVAEHNLALFLTDTAFGAVVRMTSLSDSGEVPPVLVGIVEGAAVPEHPLELVLEDLLEVIGTVPQDH